LTFLAATVKNSLPLSNISGELFSTSAYETLQRSEKDSILEQNISKRAKHNALQHPHLLSPPPVPKRRYCSVGVGDNIPIDNVVCYSRDKVTKDASTSCCNFTSPSSIQSSATATSYNADLYALPPPPKDICLVHSSCQTCTDLATSATQTRKVKRKEKGCGNERLTEVKLLS